VLSGGTFEASELMFSGNTASNVGNDVVVNNDTAIATLKNALIATPQSTGVAIDVRAGRLDIRSSTVADQDTGIHIHSGASAIMHRNVMAYNTVGTQIDGAATGNCNLSQSASESPSGTRNDVGTPWFVTGLRSDYQLGANNPLVIDVCDAGPIVDVDGKSRPTGLAFDRGAYERP